VSCVSLKRVMRFAEACHALHTDFWTDYARGASLIRGTPEPPVRMRLRQNSPGHFHIRRVDALFHGCVYYGRVVFIVCPLMIVFML
jgi:hypothetical protein